MKRIISMFLAVILLASLLISAVPAKAFAAEITPEPETVAVHVFDQDGNEIWSGTAIKGEPVNAWLDSNVADAIAKADFTADKWYNKDAGIKFADDATFNGWTNVMVKYEAAETSGSAEDTPDSAASDATQTTEVTEAEEENTETIAAPANTHEVHFSVDGNDDFWWLNVVNGNTVKNPGIEYSTDYTYLKKVTDVDNRAFKGWSTDKNATTGYPLDIVANLVVTNPVTYYAIYDTVSVDPPTNSNGNGITNKDNTNKVYLHVYLNGNASAIQLTKDITDSYLLDDDKTSNGEIWTYLTKNYYKATDTTLGVQIDGLYVNTGSSGTFPQNYYTDNKVSELNNINALLDNGYVHINVMLKNVTAFSNSVADPTLPKTGDSIYVAASVMGISAIALAAAFYVFNKKRYTM